MAQLIEANDIGLNDPVALARELVPLLSANAAKTEEQRRVSDDNIEAMEKAGLFRLFQPRRYGGSAAGMGAFTMMLAELAAGCASCAWVASVYNHCAWIASLFPEHVLDEVWGAQPAAKLCGVFQAWGKAEAIDGGIRLTGKWPYGSGSLHAQWAVLGYAAPGEEGASRARVALVPMCEITIEDTWKVSGLKGTGSHSIVAEGVVVREDRTLPLQAFHAGELRGRYPGEATFDTPHSMMLCTLAVGPMLGLGRAMLDLTLATTGKRAMYSTVYSNAAEAPTVHIQLGEAASLIDAAAMFAERLTMDADRHAAAGTVPSEIDRARVRMDTAAVALQVAKAIDLLIDINGASSFADKNPVQRMWRDFEVMRRHASVGTEISKEHYGRILLGKSGVSLIA
jgi:alkylation response protein AidB-like acyl-CoA dehydrogenase